MAQISRNMQASKWSFFVGTGEWTELHVQTIQGKGDAADFETESESGTQNERPALCFHHVILYLNIFYCRNWCMNRAS